MGRELKGGGVEKYRGLQQHSFLHKDAVNSLLKYKRWREAKGETITPESWLFVKTKRGVRTGKYEQITIHAIKHTFQVASERTGIKFSCHDMRRFVETQLEAARVQPNWIRKIMGKTIKGEERPYSRPKIEQLREAFKSAIPHLTLELKVITDIEREKVRMRSLIEASDLTRALKDSLLLKCQKAKKTEEVHKVESEFQSHAFSRVEKRTRTETNGGQMIVSEEELPNHLSHGWKVAAVLPSGKIVIEKA